MAFGLQSFDLLVVVQQREDIVGLQFVPAVQEIELHDKTQAGDFGAQLCCQFGRGFGGTASGEQIVHDNDALSFLDGVCMDLQRVAAVFQIVIETLLVAAGSLPGLRTGTKPAFSR